MGIIFSVISMGETFHCEHCCFSVLGGPITWGFPGHLPAKGGEFFITKLAISSKHLTSMGGFFGKI